MDGARPGIVASVQGKEIVVVDGGFFREAFLSPNIPSSLIAFLVVGDRVAFVVPEDQSGRVEIVARSPRASVLVRFKSGRKGSFSGMKDERVVAANVDVAVIVASKSHPDFHPRFVDRYLVLCENGGIEPIVCINKSDLPGESHQAIGWYRAAGIPVVETSTKDVSGIDALREKLSGKVSVLVGSSGVGKTSLANALLGSELLTNDVSAKTGKGKHTTTASSLYVWAPDSYLIDTPGIRSLGVFHIDKTDLQLGFPEFEPYTDACQYRDCTHSHEPVCGVKEAAMTGDIQRYRYESYLRMLEE